ncbi:MAG: DUF3426 domain-containing protein [Nitrosopumilaceae archaeon]|nr:DUF3426 domain-containing protein [Nitrosopumilaceae archaeon]
MRLGLALVVAVAAATTHPAWADVYVQNDRMYVGGDGSLHIVGEVYNGLDAPLGQVAVDVQVYDGHDEVAAGSGWSLINTVMPGMVGPFDIVITDADTRRAHDYTATVDYSVRSPKSQVIDVTSASLERSSQGDLFVTGTVVNRGQATANMISVVATIYDRDGNVATVARTQPEPDYLRADHEWVFVVPIPERDQTREVAGYSLVAESEEYAAVPEFPLGSTVVMAASAAGYVLLTRNSSIMRSRA